MCCEMSANFGSKISVEVETTSMFFKITVKSMELKCKKIILKITRKHFTKIINYQLSFCSWRRFTVHRLHSLRDLQLLTVFILIDVLLASH